MPNLPEELLVEIGRVAAHAAELDIVTASLWAAATGEKPDQIDDVPWIVRIAGRHVPSLRDRISQEAATWPADTRKPVISWLARAASLMAERTGSCTHFGSASSKMAGLLSTAGTAEAETRSATIPTCGGTSRSGLAGAARQVGN